MFYADILDNQLRFGDVVKGFVLATSAIEKPIMIRNEQHNYQVDINFPNLCVILSPCCTINEKTKNDGIIAISPLIPIWVSFFDNQYFKEDLLSINKKMKPEQAVSPEIWARFSLEEQERRKSEGISYALLELFVYQKNDYFIDYPLTNSKHESFTTNFFMINFRNNFKVDCKALKSKETLSEVKLLQLSANARKELRDKIADFYGRTPNEDKVLLVE